MILDATGAPYPEKSKVFSEQYAKHSADWEEIFR